MARPWRLLRVLLLARALLVPQVLAQPVRVLRAALVVACWVALRRRVLVVWACWLRALRLASVWPLRALRLVAWVLWLRAVWLLLVAAVCWLA